jgi:hypothetical protein
LLLVGRQQTPRLVQHGAHAAMALRSVAVAGDQDVEIALKCGDHLLDRQ